MSEFERIQSIVDEYLSYDKAVMTERHRSDWYKDQLHEVSRQYRGMMKSHMLPCNAAQDVADALLNSIKFQRSEFVFEGYLTVVIHPDIAADYKHFLPSRFLYSNTTPLACESLSAFQEVGYQLEGVKKYTYRGFGYTQREREVHTAYAFLLSIKEGE